jgi:hypothetical protein
MVSRDGLEWITRPWTAMTYVGSDTTILITHTYSPLYTYFNRWGFSHPCLLRNLLTSTWGGNVHMRTDSKDRVRVQLVCSKNRLAPVKNVTAAPRSTDSSQATTLLRSGDRVTKSSNNSLDWLHGDLRLDTWRPKPLENFHMQQGYGNKRALHLHSGGTALEKTIQLIIFQGASRLIDWRLWMKGGTDRHSYLFIRENGPRTFPLQAARSQTKNTRETSQSFLWELTLHS